MFHFNLIHTSWIPVRWLDGRHSLVSLSEVFGESSAIADLDVPPHERVALVRLLVCILQAAAGAPESHYDWPGFGGDLEAEVNTYLSRPDIAPHFELFGDGPRFLQVKVPAKSEPVPTSKLVPDLATGNNPTLFDHAAGPERALSPARLALALLTFQAFYPLYGAGYKGKGPCVDGNMVHTLLIGACLRETLLLNSLDLESIHSFSGGMGRPIWELSGKDAETIATTSYLGRLVPRHRDLWLEEDGKGFSLRQQSFQYPTYPDAREPSATLVRIDKKDGEIRVLPARLNRSLWRDLDLITTLRKKDGDLQCAPLTLQSHFREHDSGTVDLWSGSLVTDLKAKILDTVESAFTVPHGLFTETGRAIYHQGIQHAEQQSTALYFAVKACAETLKNESPPVDAAQRHFWHSLDQQRQILLDLVNAPASLTPALFADAENPWSKAVWRAARTAYTHTSPEGPTPRLTEAHIAGLKKLRPKTATTRKTAKSKALPS